MAINMMRIYRHIAFSVNCGWLGYHPKNVKKNFNQSGQPVYRSLTGGTVSHVLPTIAKQSNCGIRLLQRRRVV